MCMCDSNKQNKHIAADDTASGGSIESFTSMDILTGFNFFRFAFVFSCKTLVVTKKPVHFTYTVKKQPIFYSFQMYGCFLNINQYKHH